MIWDPRNFWKNEDVVIIGGGTSLRGFNWELLKPYNVIGCNSAFRLGVEICKVCVFGDAKFYDKFSAQLSQFAGIVVTNCPHDRAHREPWIRFLKRRPRGLFDDGVHLGWNGNTGALAINLALCMGAKRVFLLGYDMTPDEEHKPNWHDYQIEKLNPVVYEKFLNGFDCISAQLGKVFPGREVYNVTTESNLTCFPWVDPKVLFGDKVWR